MFKFFRKIREQLIKEGSLKRYLLYAIGEILLVMIGILLAVQVNNWNENRKLKNTEQKLLLALKTEYQQNQIGIESQIATIEHQVSSMKDIIVYLGENVKNASKSDADNVLIKVSRDNMNFKSNSAVLQDILNSGNLNIITNDQLRMKLSSWAGILNGIQVQEEIVESYRNQLKQVSIKKGNMYNLFSDLGVIEKEGVNFQIIQDQRDMLADVQFANLIMYKIASSNSLKNEYEQAKDYIKEILELVEISLK